MQVQLYSGSIQGGQPLEKGATAPAQLDRACMLVYEGIFQSLDGEVAITSDVIDRLASVHNTTHDRLSQLSEGAVALKDSPPIQLDHSRSARDTVGRLVGPLRSDLAVVEGKTVRALFGTVRFLGQENVEKAIDGRFTNVSIGADLETGILSELSVTPFPAAAKASLLSKGSNMPTPEQMKRCRKYLTEEKKMSEKDADEKLAALSEDDAKKLSDEVDEHEKKLAAEKDDKEKDLAAEKDEKDKDLAHAEPDGDEGKKLSAAKPKLVKLMGEANEAIRLAKLEARKSEVAVKLSQLRAKALLTPAEEKALLAELDVGGKKIRLAEADDRSLDLLWAVLAAREPVVHTGALGTIKAVDLSKTGEAMKNARLANEVAGNMPFTSRMMKASGAEGDDKSKLRLMPSDQLQEQDEPTPSAQSLEQQGAQLASLQSQISKLSELTTAIAEALA